MTRHPRFSVIVPAHNEEALLRRGLDAIEHAITRSGSSTEIIVVANRCTDRTESIAEACGGCHFALERTSPGLALTRVVDMTLSRTGVVMYWCSQDEYDAIVGFDETKPVGEDFDFGKRLRRHARATLRGTEPSYPRR